MELRRAENAVLTTDRPRIDRESGSLWGSRCTKCAATSWPARAICSACGSDGLEVTRLPTVGQLLSYTVVWVQRKNLTTPYVLGQVHLGNGAVLFAHVRDLPPDTAVPTEVRLRLASDGAEPSFWFEPRVPENTSVKDLNVAP